MEILYIPIAHIYWETACQLAYTFINFLIVNKPTRWPREYDIYPKRNGVWDFNASNEVSAFSQEWCNCTMAIMCGTADVSPKKLCCSHQGLGNCLLACYY